MRPHLLILSNRSTNWGPSIQTHKPMGSFSPIHHRTWAPAFITLLSDSTRKGTRPSRSCHHASRREGLHPLSFRKQLVCGGYSHCSRVYSSLWYRDFLWGAGASCPSSWCWNEERNGRRSTMKSSIPRTTKHKRLWGGKQGWGNTKFRHQKTSMSAKLNLNFTKLLDVIIMNNSHMGEGMTQSI